MNELYQPSPRWHPASRDAYDERIAILMEGHDAQQMRPEGGE